MNDYKNKRARNINGRGTTYEENNLYAHQISYIDPRSGERKRKKFKAKKAKDAVKKADEFLANIKAGFDITADKMLIKDWVKQWLDDFVAQRVRPRTLEKYQSCLDCYILPQLGEMPLMKLTSVVLQKHFNSLLKTGGIKGAGISSSTVRNTRRYFTSCLDEAVKHGFLLRNPAKDTNPPKLVTKEHVLLTDDDIKRIFVLAENIPDSYMSKVMPVILRITLDTGMRMGEVFGLKWNNIDFDANFIYLSHTIARIKKAGYVLQEPKTKSSRRKILMTGDDMRLLKGYGEWQENLKKRAGENYTDSNFVFANMFGRPIDISNFTRHFRQLLNAAGISKNFTFHSLRHNHASMLLKAGVNPKVIQERLGHSNISVTLDIYSHIMPDMQKDAVAAIEKNIKF